MLLGAPVPSLSWPIRGAAPRRRCRIITRVIIPIITNNTPVIVPTNRLFETLWLPSSFAGAPVGPPLIVDVGDGDDDIVIVAMFSSVRSMAELNTSIADS